MNDVQLEREAALRVLEKLEVYDREQLEEHIKEAETAEQVIDVVDRFGEHTLEDLGRRSIRHPQPEAVA